MHGRRLLKFLLVAGGILLISLTAFASVFEPVSDQQLVCESTDVVRGTVANVQSAWDRQHQAIWTTATLNVQEVIRGSLAPGASLTVKEVGGTVDGYTIQAEGFPTFREGEEVVALLKPWEDEPSAYRVWGYNRGKFKVDRRGVGKPTTIRHDVTESGRPTMAVDRIPPTIVLDALTRELGALSRACERGGPQR